MRRFGGYGRDFPPRRYDRDFGGRGVRGGPPGYRGDYDDPRGAYDATGWAPFAMTPFAWDPTLGWAGWGAGTGYVPPGPPERDRGPERDRRPERVPPERSPLYGRGGDRALRRWAERYGYDFEYSIPPRPGPRDPRYPR